MSSITGPGSESIARSRFGLFTADSRTLPFGKCGPGREHTCDWLCSIMKFARQMGFLFGSGDFLGRGAPPVVI